VHRLAFVFPEERFTGLAPVSADTMRDAVLDLARAGTSVVLSTFGILDHGRNVLSGAMSAIKASWDRRGVVLELDTNRALGARGETVENGGDPSLIGLFDAAPRRQDSQAAWELFRSVGLLLAGIAVAAWGAARVFRVGILMTGKRFSLREALRWARYRHGG
jgi:ABC-type multidrug transport system ATPase subunit